MAGCESNGVVEEEKRSPRARLIERMLPVAELGAASNPQRPLVVTGEAAGVVDETAPIARKHPVGGLRVKVTPWVDPVSTWHIGIQCKGPVLPQA